MNKAVIAANAQQVSLSLLKKERLDAAKIPIDIAILSSTPAFKED